MTQNDLILAHLQSVGPITPLEALNEYGSLRLGARIYDLRRLGHNIHTDLITVGKDKKVGKYTLLQQARAAA